MKKIKHIILLAISLCVILVLLYFLNAFGKAPQLEDVTMIQANGLGEYPLMFVPLFEPQIKKYEGIAFSDKYDLGAAPLGKFSYLKYRVIRGASSADWQKFPYINFYHNTGNEGEIDIFAGETIIEIKIGKGLRSNVYTFKVTKAVKQK